jgi:hypothetical protein
MAWGTRLLCALSISGSLVSAPSLQHADLQKQMEDATRGFDGRIGVCVQDSSRFSCINGDERFPLQSVMKLLVAIAVMDAVDRGEWRLAERVVVRKQDLSLAVQPLATLVTENGFNTTIDDLVRRAVVDSDSAATDFLVARLGGPRAVQLALERHHVTDVRFDRDERHLQTEIAGLEWRPEFVDAEVLDRIRGGSGRKKGCRISRLSERPARYGDAAWHDQASAITRREPAALRIVYEAPAGDHDPDGHVSRSLDGGCLAGLDPGAQDRNERNMARRHRRDERRGHPHGAGLQGNQSCGVHRGFSSGAIRSSSAYRRYGADDHQALSQQTSC